jgi:hypothetical protein
MIIGVDRFAQPLQSELDIVRLQMAPALDLDLVSVLREALEDSMASFFAAWRSLVNFSRMKGSFGISGAVNVGTYKISGACRRLRRFHTGRIYAGGWVMARSTQSA